MAGFSLGEAIILALLAVPVHFLVRSLQKLWREGERVWLAKVWVAFVLGASLVAFAAGMASSTAEKTAYRHEMGRARAREELCLAASKKKGMLALGKFSCPDSAWQ